MATTTVIRMTRLFDIEIVTQVTGGASPFGAIRINTANTRIRPGCWIQGTIGLDPNDRPGFAIPETD